MFHLSFLVIILTQSRVELIHISTKSVCPPMEGSGKTDIAAMYMGGIN